MSALRCIVPPTHSTPTQNGRITGEMYCALFCLASIQSNKQILTLRGKQDTAGLNDSGLGQARNSERGSPNTVEAHSQSFGIGLRVRFAQIGLEVLGAEASVLDTSKQQNRWEFWVIFEKHVCRLPSMAEIASSTFSGSEIPKQTSEKCSVPFRRR